MKFLLLILSCVCLYVTYELGGKYASQEFTAGFIGGAIGAGLIGAASVLGAAIIQVSENKSKKNTHSQEVGK